VASQPPALAHDPGLTAPQSARGIEGQRKADLGNGTYLNPIMAGDHPDPTLLKDGDHYYLTFSSFDSYPGIVIWTSRDLVNWQPLTAASAHADRLGMGAGVGQAQWPLLCIHTRAHPNLPFQLRHPLGKDHRTLERAGGSRAPGSH